LPSAVAQGFTAFQETSYRQTNSLTQNFSLYFAKTTDKTYRIELNFETPENLRIEDQNFVLENASSDRKILLDGTYYPIKSAEFTARVDRDSLKRNYSFSAVVQATPITSENVSVGQEVILEREFDYHLFTTSDQIRENRQESRRYKGSLLNSDPSEGQREKTGNNPIASNGTSIVLQDSAQDKQSKESVNGEEGVSWFLVAGIVLVVLYIMKEVMM
ncbi:MAG: hypothetical protein ABEK16_02855, partial [Candidatus Nanohalobium sp.]